MTGRKWIVTGSLCLGLLIGLMVGLSISPVVSTVLGLIFAFAGGSIVVLIKGRQDNELGLIGKSLTAISIAIIIGAISGIVLRTNDWLRIDRETALHVPFQLEKPLSVDDIITLSQKEIDPVVIRALLKADAEQKQKIALTMRDIDKLAKHKVHPTVIRAMVDEKALSDDSPFMLSQQDIVELKKSGIHPLIIMTMIANSAMPTQSTKNDRASNHRKPVLYVDVADKDELKRDLENDSTQGKK